MKMNKKLLVLLLGVVMVFAMTACGKTAPEPSEDGQSGDPLAIVNVEDNGDVTFHCTVNGEWLTDNDKGNTTTRHFIVAEDGFNKGKSVLSAYAPAVEIYEAMIKAGFEPEEKNEEVFTLDNGELLNDGQKIEITLTWAGQEEPVSVNDVLLLSDGSRPELDFHFHGNHANFQKNYSGCVTCLDSCYVGLTSNGKYGFLEVEKNNPSILGDAKVLPANGEVVMVRFSKAK